MNKSVWEVIKSIFKTSFPVISIIVILGWISVINLIFMKRINQGKVAPEFNEFSVILPTKAICERFDNAVSRLFLQIETLVQQSDQLVKARDLLLPKLMNGEVSV